MCAAFSKKDVFPVVGEIIDRELLVNESINRDEIAKKLLDHSKIKEIISQAIFDNKIDDLLKTSGNMVDWFSAEITKRSNIAALWVNKYYRIRVKVDGREVWNYLLNPNQAFIEKVQASFKNTEARAKRLASASKKPKIKITKTLTFDRNPDVVAEILHQANGSCQQCGVFAPFFRKSDNTPYLEVHHKIPLALGGEDTVKNTIALCPNCHRKAHYG